MNILVIRKEDADYWDSLIQSPAVDLDELELPKNELLARWTTTFDDGVQADLKVCSSEDTVWCEMVWFSKDGVELTCSDPCSDTLEGEWPCSLAGYDVFVETRDITGVIYTEFQSIARDADKEARETKEE